MPEYYEVPTKKSLDRGLFWMTHRKMFRNILLITAYLIVFGILGFSVFKFYQYSSSSTFEEQARALSLQADWSVYHRQNGPDDLISYDANALQISPTSYDLVVFVENPNEEWAVTNLGYHFLVNGVILESDNAFINPGETKILFDPGYKSNRPISSIELKIESVDWQRVEGDEALFVEWEIEDVVFNPTTREQINANQSFTIPPSVTWKATNTSLYDFWEVIFQVTLYNGSSLVGIREWKEDKFYALESKEFEVTWANDLPRVTKVEIIPILNLLDKGNLMDIEADIFKY